MSTIYTELNFLTQYSVHCPSCSVLVPLPAVCSYHILSSDTTATHTHICIAYSFSFQNSYMPIRSNIDHKSRTGETLSKVSCPASLSHPIACLAYCHLTLTLLTISLETFWHYTTKSCIFHTLHIYIYQILHMLNCKLNSTNGGIFSNSAEKMILIFFFFRRPK